MPCHRLIGSQHFETTVLPRKAMNWLCSDVVSCSTRRETQDSDCDFALWRKKCVYKLWLIRVCLKINVMYIVWFASWGTTSTSVCIKMRHLVTIVNGDTYNQAFNQKKKKRKRFKRWRETSVFCPSSILVFLILSLGHIYERKPNLLLLRIIHIRLSMLQSGERNNSVLVNSQPFVKLQMKMIRIR